MTRVEIDNLVADLRPVRLISPADVLMLVSGTTAFAITAVALKFGLRPDVMDGNPSSMVLIRSGILLILGAAALAAVIASARPGVGQYSHGWRWALAAAAVFPLATVGLAISNGALPVAELAAKSGPWCLGISISGALFVGAAQTFWLRKGAPTSLERAGWLVGLGAGAFGTFAYSLHCPTETVSYIGIWYSLAVAASAGLGRLAVPRFLRW